MHRRSNSSNMPKASLLYINSNKRANSSIYLRIRWCRNLYWLSNSQSLWSKSFTNFLLIWSAQQWKDAKTWVKERVKLWYYLQIMAVERKCARSIEPNIAFWKAGVKLQYVAKSASQEWSRNASRFIAALWVCSSLLPFASYSYYYPCSSLACLFEEKKGAV